MGISLNPGAKEIAADYQQSGWEKKLKHFIEHPIDTIGEQLSGATNGIIDTLRSYSNGEHIYNG